MIKESDNEDNKLFYSKNLSKMLDDIIQYLRGLGGGGLAPTST
jgi:hypothetical protein